MSRQKRAVASFSYVGTIQSWLALTCAATAQLALADPSKAGKRKAHQPGTADVTFEMRQTGQPQGNRPPPMNPNAYRTRSRANIPNGERPPARLAAPRVPLSELSRRASLQRWKYPSSLLHSKR